MSDEPSNEEPTEPCTDPNADLPPHPATNLDTWLMNCAGQLLHHRDAPGCMPMNVVMVCDYIDADGKRSLHVSKTSTASLWEAHGMASFAAHTFIEPRSS